MGGIVMPSVEKSGRRSIWALAAGPDFGSIPQRSGASRLRNPRALAPPSPLFAFLCAMLALSPQAALAQFKQDGPKLVGLLATQATQGQSVAISADGSTAIVGGPSDDNPSVGAAWIFVRGANGLWTQQGNKLIGTGVSGRSEQGFSVALSANGNTAIVGGPIDNNSVGAAWVFVRSNGLWRQQGKKLVGTGAVGPTVGQGSSVALSADGSTAIVGGFFDNANVGAAWIFVRSTSGVWSQQGPKLVGSGAVGPSNQGVSVAMSADASTAIVGGSGDNSNGADWVFINKNGSWTQQGAKLVGNGAVGAPQQGAAALSGDGATAIFGGADDNAGVGAAWVFARSKGVWSQQGKKLVGTGAIGKAAQGHSVGLSADGSTAILGGRMTTPTWGRSGRSPARTDSGPSWAASWSGQTRSDPS
jgi:hypothetical protein